jgi:hypothetical protein
MEKTAKNFAIWMAVHCENFYPFAHRISRFGSIEQTECDRVAQKEFRKKHESVFMQPSWNTNRYLDVIHKVGIDWDKCLAPVSLQQNLFVGTFADDEIIEVVRGELFLLDGSKIQYVAECKVDTNQFEVMQSFFKEQ